MHLVVEACAIIFPPMGLIWGPANMADPSTCETTWFVMTTATPNYMINHYLIKLLESKGSIKGTVIHHDQWTSGASGTVPVLDLTKISTSSANFWRLLRNLARCICLADSSPLPEKSVLYRAVALSTIIRANLIKKRHLI